ncbi:type II toxin-antitoxin system RatA family toxin [Halarchaeum sp. P4]|uniref:type II toxin-antitoxin system RatA family toxin n=1 Tax=Halarchaeum sp. P4 TaxID=3421639 RepID=UPI003EBBA381
MKTVEVSTTVYAPPGDVYDFLLDFPGYANYSKHLQSVRADGEGGPGTDYYLTFAWWKLDYTLHSRVTDVTRPERIDWEVVEDFDAAGQWVVEELETGDGEGETDDGRPACEVRLVVTYDPDSAQGTLDLPLFVSLDWVIEKASKLVVEEGERVVERVVADLEGERRAVDLRVDVY